MQLRYILAFFYAAPVNTPVINGITELYNYFFVICV